MTPTAIPTRYHGVQFRSRLEARWAAMFDLLGWGWEYEPIDLPGWIPDFRVGDTLIEVTPASDLGAHRAKMYAAGCPDINGNDGLDALSWHVNEARKLCVFVERFPLDEAMARVPIPQRALCLTERVFVPGANAADNLEAFCGLFTLMQGGYNRELIDVWNRKRPEQLWREAGNRVQWKGSAAIL